MEPTTSRSKSLAEITADQIADFIITEKMQPGDKLPNETILGNTLAVSRTTIREAEKILISRNIIRTERGRGTFVTQTPGVSDDPFGFRFIQDKRKLMLELLQLRLIIEPPLAALAAANATDEEINRLLLLEGKIEEAFNRGEDHTLYDVDFHNEIANCSHNSVVKLILPLLLEAVPLTIAYTKRTLVADAIRDHHNIINAIIHQDGPTAKTCMEQHLNINVRFVETYIENQQ